MTHVENGFGATSSLAADDSAPLLEVTDLRTTFLTGRGAVHAVDGVSFTLKQGSTLGIVGESGSGKTVLARSVMRLLPPRHVASEGKVSYRGIDITALGQRDLRRLWGREITMVFQDPMTALNPVVRIGRQLTEHLRLHLHMDHKSAREQAIATLASVGIPEPERRMRDYPYQLSGGMRQRVMIAIALACGPHLLLADEPTTGLDVTIQAQILDLLAKMSSERFMGLVLVTHDLAVVANYADQVIVMYAGKVVERAATSELFARVHMPYTQALFRSIPSLDLASHSRLATVEGHPPSLLGTPPPGCRFAPRCPYAEPRCRIEEPPLVEAEPGHWYACWYPRDEPALPRTGLDREATPA